MLTGDAHQRARLFTAEGLAPRQPVSLVFQFAIANGFFELMEFIWSRVNEVQREYIGMLQWSRVCFEAKHRSVMHFLCHRLCNINPNGLARVTWNSFYTAFYYTLQDEETVSKVERDENVRKLQFLLDNCCPKLRSAMLSMDNYKALSTAFIQNHEDTFSLFLDNLTGDQLRSAREFVDRVFDRTPERVADLRRLLIRRQFTVQ